MELIIVLSLMLFVRDDKEKTKKLTEFTNELPGELSNDKYVIRDSITF